MLDTQKRGLIAVATNSKYLTDIILSSSSQVVAEPNSTFQLKFVAQIQLIETDYIKIQMPKWNPNSNFIQKPIMSYGSSPVCYGILRTK